MNNLLPAIVTKMSGSALSTDVGGRIYLDQAPDGAALPYVVFSIIASYSEDTFAERIDETLVQFSLYSDEAGAAVITDMYSDLRSLLDDASLSITSNAHLRCQYQNLETMIESGVRHWAVDYLITKRVS